LKALIDVRPTREQLPIISNPQNGITLIRGAAGSGKTTTALLMLKQLSEFWIRHRERNNNENPVRIQVFTYNRTLKGYIAHLAENQISKRENVILNVTTFAKWNKDLIGTVNIISSSKWRHIISKLGNKSFLGNLEFLLKEVDYCLGKFLPENLTNYLTTRRDGRGISPRIDKALRERLLEEVIAPYNEYKIEHSLMDWNDMVVELIELPSTNSYEVIIVDETQDLSANQIRAIIKHASDPGNLVFVLDAAQRIYPRGWNWREVGITINPNRSFHLKENHRNTIEICMFARPILEGMDLGDDGHLPDLSSCRRHGDIPKVIFGKYSNQISFAIDVIKNNINLENESVAFAHPKAGRWFDYLRVELTKKCLRFVDMTRRSEWPDGDENIALISMNSAKGLEFDHIFILGLDEEITQHGNEEGDSDWENLRRLLTMTITRARKTVTLGSKPGNVSSLFSCLKKDTYEEILL
jgi:superfamily I DNA/RNA helicase